MQCGVESGGHGHVVEEGGGRVMSIEAETPARATERQNRAKPMPARVRSGDSLGGKVADHSGWNTQHDKRQQYHHEQSHLTTLDEDGGHRRLSKLVM
jgi:hypothetical protein